MSDQFLPVQNFAEDSPANEQSQSLDDIVPDPLKMAEIRPQVLEVLGTVFDPEIPVNIRDMGLIYDVLVDKDGSRWRAHDVDRPGLPGGAEPAGRSARKGGGRARRHRGEGRDCVGSALDQGENVRGSEIAAWVVVRSWFAGRPLGRPNRHEDV